MMISADNDHPGRTRTRTYYVEVCSSKFGGNDSQQMPVTGCLSTFCTGTLGITLWRMIFNGFCLNGKGVPRGSFRQTHPLPKWKMNIFVCTFPIGWMQNRTVFYVMYFRDREWGPAQVGLSIISLESDSICWSVGHIYNEDNNEKSWILNSDSDHISHLRRAL